MKTAKIDKIVMEVTCPRALDEKTWNKHLKSIETVCKKVKNGLSYKVYRMAPKP